MEKKKPRRRRTNTATKTKATKKTVKASEVVNQVVPKASVNDVIEPVTPLTGIERLNAIPDYTELSPPNVISRTIHKYYAMKPEELRVKAKEADITILESSIINLIIRSNSKKTRNSLEMMKYIHDRIEGKVKDRVEHTGARGKPLEIKTTTKHTFDIDSMTRAERAKLKKVLLAAKQLPTRVVDDGGEKE